MLFEQCMWALQAVGCVVHLGRSREESRVRELLKALVTPYGQTQAVAQTGN